MKLAKTFDYFQPSPDLLFQLSTVYVILLPQICHALNRKNFYLFFNVNDEPKLLLNIRSFLL